DEANLSRADPIAVEAVGHAMAEMHQRDGTGFDILRVEHGKIAAVLPRAPDRGKQPAIALGGVSAAFDKHRLGNSIAGGQEIMAKTLALAVDMDDAGQRAEHRQIRVSAGVPAMAALQAGAAIVDARELAGQIVVE